MLVQIRGTSGSGKSWVMRQVMKSLGQWIPEYKPGRKRPLYYRCNDTLILGHYEIDCGGCDTIGSAPEVYEALKSLPKARHILTEGLLWSGDVKWTVALRDEGYDPRAVYLTTDMETCLRQVNSRQAGRVTANPERVALKLSKRFAEIARTHPRLLAEGIMCRRVAAAQAPSLILNWLRENQ